MRSARVICLLISLIQFIFFLKLIEYVRGEELQPPSQPLQQVLRRNGELRNSFGANGSSKNNQVEGRGLFLAPKMRKKKLRKNKPIVLPGEKVSDNQKNNLTRSDVPIVVDGVQQGRLCPACENNECQVSKPLSAGFPLVPVVLSIMIGVAWYVLFLIFWLFFIRPQDIDKHPDGGIGDGYGGYDSPSTTYGPEHDDDDDKPSIFDHFLKPHERSLSAYSSKVISILDAIGKFADLYNDT